MQQTIITTLVGNVRVAINFGIEIDSCQPDGGMAIKRQRLVETEEGDFTPEFSA